MWQKMALAFLAGGIAVGTVVYLGLRERESQTSARVEAASPAPFPSAAPVAEAREVPPQTPAAATTPSAEPVAKAPAARPATARKAPAPPPRERLRSAPETREVAFAQTAPPPPPPAVTPAAEKEERVSPAQAPAPAPPPPAQPAATPALEQLAPPKREPRTITVPAGTLLTVRLRDTLSTERHSTHDAFFATLDAPLIVEGLVIAERGALVRGRIAEAAQAGRVKGRAALVLQLDELATSDGQKAEIRTDPFRHEAESGVKNDVAKAGVAAGIGAAIGAIAGGGKGAAIGAAIGGAAGAGGAMATRGKPAELRSETRLTFRLSEPLTLTEKLP